MGAIMQSRYTVVCGCTATLLAGCFTGALSLPAPSAGDGAVADLAALPPSPCCDASVDDLGAPFGSQNNPAPSCLAILNAGASTGNGTYWLNPGGAAFPDTCEMTIDGGGWTQLIPTYASQLTGRGIKRYLYLYDNRWYESPPTTLNWTWEWSSGQQLTGTYDYFDGSSSGSITCGGSNETPMFGVGCSNGPGPTCKVLPYYASDATDGTCELCQDCPDAFGTGACTPANSVSVFVR
jgi:hypothetical protein